MSSEAIRLSGKWQPDVTVAADRVSFRVRASCLEPGGRTADSNLPMPRKRNMKVPKNSAAAACQLFSASVLMDTHAASRGIAFCAGPDLQDGRSWVMQLCQAVEQPL